MALAVFPVMYSARALGAEKTGIGSVVLVRVLPLCLSKRVETIFASGLTGALAGIFGGALITRTVRVTTYRRALLISLVSSAMAILGVLRLTKLAVGHDFNRRCIHAAADLLAPRRLINCPGSAPRVPGRRGRLAPGSVAN